MTSATSFDAAYPRAVATDARVGKQIAMTAMDRSDILALPEAQWDQLVRSALVENPFYTRMQVQAALDSVDRGKALRGLAFHAPDGLLIGLFLFQPRSKVPAPFAVANSLSNNYLLNGIPLIHGDHASTVVDAWLDQVKVGKAPGVWAFDDVHMDSPIVALMTKGAQARGVSATSALPYERAFLTRLEGGFEAHLNHVLSKNRLKDVRRTMRRLGEVGKVELEHAEEPALLAQRLEQFLALEHAGWKGAMGTSFLANEADAEFARQSYGPGLAAIDSLLLDGKPLAMKLSVRTGGIAYTPKIAYDEDYKKLGPGMALEYLLIEDFYASDRLDAVDAAATAEGHSALNFFNEQKPMATLIIGRHGWQVNLLRQLHEGREALKKKIIALKTKIAARREKPVVEKSEA